MKVGTGNINDYIVLVGRKKSRFIQNLKGLSRTKNKLKNVFINTLPQETTS